MGLSRVFASHYQRHPGQLAGLLLILICAAMLWNGVQTLTDRAGEAIRDSELAREPRLAVLRRDGAPLDVDDFARLRRAGFCVTPQLRVRLPGPGLELLGIDALSADCLRQQPRETAIIRGLNRGQLAGLWGTPDTLARWQQLAIAAHQDYPLHAQPQLPADLLLGDIATIEQLSHAGSSALALLMPAPLPGVLPPDYDVAVQDYGLGSTSLADSFLLSLEALGWLALLVAALLVRAVYVFAMEQRRQSLEILIRHGVDVWRLRLYLLLEVLLLCLLGGALGVWLGQALASLMAQGFRATLTGLFGVDALGQGLPAAVVWLRAVLVLLVLVTWAGFDMLLLRGRGLAGTRRAPPPAGIWNGMAGILLLQAGALGLALATPLWGVFIATAACLLGAGLMLPPALEFLLARVQRCSQRPLLEWSCSEMQALCRSLRLPLLALAFAIASAIGVQAMVTGFEATFVRWLDQRLQGDLYLDPGRPVALADWLLPLQQLPDVVEVLPMVRGRALVEQQEADVLGVEPDSVLLSGWQFLASVPEPWQALQGQGILINEQLSRRQQLKLGDWISVRLGPLEKLYQVSAIYADYGRPDAEILLASRHLPARLPQRYTTFVLGLRPGSTADWAGWSQRYPWLAAWRLRDQARLKAGASAAFVNTFSITRALSGLTLLLSGIALGLVALTLFRLRQRLYTQLYVCGLTRAALRFRLGVHAMLLTGLLGVLATPLGLLLAWVLVARVNPVAFGWALPFNLYPLYWVQVWLVCLAIGALTGLMMASPVRLETLKNE
jgi:putative ABC transport system permease protein